MDYQNTLTPEFCELVDRIEKSGLAAEVIATCVARDERTPKRISASLFTNCGLRLGYLKNISYITHK